MTVTSETRRVSYTGDGTNSALTVTFVFYDSSDIQVIRRVTATGVETVLTEDDDYTVSGGNGLTGTVTPVDGATTFTSADTWTIFGNTPRTQTTDYVANDSFPAESHEELLDRAMMAAAELEDAKVRSLRFPITDLTDDSTLDGELPNNIDRASKYLAFDADGSPIAADAPTDTTVLSTFGASLCDDADADTARETLGITQGLLSAIPASGNAGNIFIATDTYQIFRDTGAVWQELVPRRNRNLIVNGSCRVWQRGTSFTSATTYTNADDMFLVDHILLLSDGDDRIDISQETSVVPTGAYSSIKCEVETVSSPSEKWGFLFPIEARDAAEIIGGVCSLSFKARTTSGAIENIRAAILAWDSTADSITSDVVSAWGAEGTNPTLAANWTYENTPSNLALTNSFQTFTIENVSIDTASCTNVAVFIWVDDTDLTAGDLLYLTEVQLEKGASCTNFDYRTFDYDLTCCKRYFQKTFGYTVAPGNAVATAGALVMHKQVAGVNTQSLMWYIGTMFSSPTTVFYSTTAGGTLGSWYNSADGGDSGVADASTSLSDNSISVKNPGVATDGVGELIRIQGTATAEM